MSSSDPLARTRSLRHPASGLKLSSAPPAPGLKLSSALPASGPSSITLFLTNLRLLDLDLLPDWPDISLSTFSTKDQQNQKRRVQCVEWALYQLFTIWDPAETRNKLQPFFPPLEPLQSLNLRAALFRCLDQAKKGGVLGRDTVLRKTMLDECKGERLEEVLAVFSNAVLKKVVQEDAGHEAIVQSLAMENFSYNGERSMLQALILAHKSSLRKQLAEKDICRTKYQGFSDLLESQREQISTREQQLMTIIAEGSRTELPQQDIRTLQERARKNWSGSEVWLETLLYGNSRASKDGLLATNFDKVWKGVEEGSGVVDGKNQVGLLEQLDARVKSQESRLAKWRDFGLKIKQAEPPHQETKTSNGRRGYDLGFTAHQSQQLGKTSRATGTSARADGYNQLIKKMRSDLADVGKNKRLGSRQTKPRLSIAASSVLEPPANEDDWSSVPSDSEPESKSAGHKSTKLSIKKSLGGSEEDHSTHSLDDSDTFDNSNFSIVTPSRKPTKTQEELDFIGRGIQQLSIDPLRDTTPTTGSRSRSTVKSARTSSPSQASISPETDQANQILASMSAASPSPKKRYTLSLADRQPLYPAPSSSPEIQADQNQAGQILASISAASPSPKKRHTLSLADRQPLYPAPSLSPGIQADHTLTSISTASPSPKKRHTLSLAERTQLSMSRSKSSQPSPMDDPDDFSSLPLNPHLSPSPVKSPASDEAGKHDALIERTRKSMAGFEAAQKKAQLSRRRSVKEAEAKAKAKAKERESSYFPSVLEETVPSIDATELMEGDPDYADVFKSRPRIAMSPAVSPVRGGEVEELEDEEEE